jgi:hypothetical protein
VTVLFAPPAGNQDFWIKSEKERNNKWLLSNKIREKSWGHLLSCNHYYSGKAMSITQSVFVFVALGVEHAMRMRRIVIYCLFRSTKFFHIIS